MNEQRVRVDDELYLSLEVVAEIYQVRAVWLREVYDVGLLGSGVEAQHGPCIAAVQMDRVATIVRLHEVLGFDLETIVLTLDEN